MAAARMYLEAARERTLKQCIAIAASESDCEWRAIAYYLSGVGARALLQSRDTEVLREAAVRLAGPIADYADDLDQLVLSSISADATVPARLTAEVCWAAQDLRDLLDNWDEDGDWSEAGR